jgi:hypothetical protein
MLDSFLPGDIEKVALEGPLVELRRSCNGWVLVVEEGMSEGSHRRH